MLLTENGKCRFKFFFINLSMFTENSKNYEFYIPKKKLPLEKQHSNPETVARIRRSAKRPESIYY